MRDGLSIILAGGIGAEWWSVRLVEGVGRLSEFKGGKLKAPRIAKVTEFGVGAVGAAKGNAEEAEELWALSGPGGPSGRERGEYSQSWGGSGGGDVWSSCQGRRATVLSGSRG